MYTRNQSLQVTGLWSGGPKQSEDKAHFEICFLFKLSWDFFANIGSSLQFGKAKIRNLLQIWWDHIIIQWFLTANLFTCTTGDLRKVVSMCCQVGFWTTVNKKIATRLLAVFSLTCSVLTCISTTWTESRAIHFTTSIGNTMTSFVLQESLFHRILKSQCGNSL